MNVPPSGNKFLDLINNREPIISAQLPAIIAAVILGQLDKAINFTAMDPLTSTLIVYGVANVVALLWARAKVWSEASHVAEVAAAATEAAEVIEAQQDAPVAPAE